MFGCHYHKKPVKLYTELSFYYTPRAALIEHLEDANSSIAEWIDKSTGRCIILNYDRLVKNWAERAVDKNWNVGYLFENELENSVQRVTKPKKMENGEYLKDGIYIVYTKTSDRKPYRQIFKVGLLIEWIVRFLVEQTNTDWVKWENKGSLEFKVVDFDGIASQYVLTNGVAFKNPVTFARMQLSSYCVTKVLIEISRSNGHYQFNKSWYEKEISKKPKQGMTYYR